MSIGYSFDDEMRNKLITAAKKAEEGDYVALNKVIMEIQRPFVELLVKIKELL